MFRKQPFRNCKHTKSKLDFQNVYASLISQMMGMELMKIVYGNFEIYALRLNILRLV